MGVTGSFAEHALQVVETSRGGPPLAFRVGDPAMGEEQGWTDAVDGMRVGGRRRVYAKPREGKGPIARCDVEAPKTATV